MRFHLLPIFASTGALALNFNVFRREASVDNERALTKRLSSFAELMITDLKNLTDVTDVITKTIMNMTDLTGAIAVNTTTGYLFEALEKATADAKTGTSISALDAQALGPPTQFLAYAANESIAALIEKKPLFLQFGIQTLVITSLQGQINASNGFSSVLLSKIDPKLLPVSEALNSQVVTSLNQGLDCFEGKNETCNPTPVNASRTVQAAMDSGAIPKGAAGRTMEVSGLLGLGAAIAAGVMFAA